ncbi:MAG: hypothetical protein K9W46_10965 [Candidatus Heimdallarchaeum endolithica]|uniref:Uncharacterized protein n=1 Tax=Candidatus Heimdallarchaeum endolithica TaxID=2876572 RepID=A0A9Y1BQ56_9ARCH|nr:MAG: hypothetical protein K9W46_10965 [Candidatus Heimdallarchaeum endolithica]
MHKNKKGKIKVHKGKLDELTLMISRLEKVKDRRRNVLHNREKMSPYCPHNKK